MRRRWVTTWNTKQRAQRAAAVLLVSAMLSLGLNVMRWVLHERISLHIALPILGVTVGCVIAVLITVVPDAVALWQSRRRR